MNCSEIHCFSCDLKWNTFEFGTELSLPISSTSESIVECISSYFRVKAFDDENKYNWEPCGSTTKLRNHRSSGFADSAESNKWRRVRHFCTKNILKSFFMIPVFQHKIESTYEISFAWLGYDCSRNFRRNLHLWFEERCDLPRNAEKRTL